MSRSILRDSDVRVPVVHPPGPGLRHRPRRPSTTTHAEAEGRPQPGPTRTDNLAALCRFHHRLKTHTAWRYRMIEPGVFEWTSPHGHRYRRDRHGTTPIDQSRAARHPTTPPTMTPPRTPPPSGQRRAQARPDPSATTSPGTPGPDQH